MRLPATLYHGTSTGYLDQILRDGLCPPFPDCRPDVGSYTCWIDTCSVAEFHAHHMEEWDSDSLERKCDPIVFAVPIERFKLYGFVLEQNFIRLGISGEGGRNAGIELRGKKWTWRKLLKFTGAVGYELPLPVTPEMIIRLERRPDILEAA
jgi:hypothetical protein